jgi:hypothetical protein
LVPDREKPPITKGTDIMKWTTLMMALGVLGLGWMVETPEAQEREKTTVAVEHFEAGAGLEDVAAQVSDALMARLVAHFTLLTRKDMDAVLAEHRRIVESGASLSLDGGCGEGES